MQASTKLALLNIQAKLLEVKNSLVGLDPQDIDTAGGLSAAEESLNYAKSQVENALMTISNIC